MGGSRGTSLPAPVGSLETGQGGGLLGRLVSRLLGLFAPKVVEAVVGHLPPQNRRLSREDHPFFTSKGRLGPWHCGEASHRRLGGGFIVQVGSACSAHLDRGGRSTLLTLQEPAPEAFTGRPRVVLVRGLGRVTPKRRLGHKLRRLFQGRARGHRTSLPEKEVTRG